MRAYTRWQINYSINRALHKGYNNDLVIDSLIDLMHDNKHRDIFFSDELTTREEDFIKHFKK